MGAGRPPLFAENFDGPDSAGRVAQFRSPLAVLADGAGVGGTRALRLTYSGDGHGSTRFVATVPLSRPVAEATLSYDVRFDRDFQFVLGGKLHGLGPRRVITGGEPLQPDGWSARVMWRKGGTVETYTYHQDQLDRYGEAGKRRLPFRFERERWYAVSLHVRVNTPAREANGLVRLFIDGRLVEQRDRLRLRAVDTPDSLIAKMVFSTFFGGHDPSWAPRRADGSYADVHATFDDFVVDPGVHIRQRPGG